MRLARLMRSPAPSPENVGGMAEGAMVVEVGGARVTVGRGADLQAVVMVLALLRGGGR